jgi:prepilin-type N-terminal cleavage/methylation domain-containing protein
MKVKISRKSGFTLVEIMIVVAIIGLLAVIAIPNFIRARETSQANVCISNLRQLDSAVQQWALENDGGPASSVSLNDAKPYIGHNSNSQLPHCPAGGTYAVTDVSSKPTCTIADSVTPAHVLPL